MVLIVLYTALLIFGMGVSQALDISAWQNVITWATTICLAYIMIGVGLEFYVDQQKLKSYTYDFWMAMSAAIFPTILCMFYFLWVFRIGFKEALLVGLSTAPTSAGVLFAMLTAAGLAKTWVFQKARNLAILDDLGTILLIIIMKIWWVGFQPELLTVIFIFLFLGMAAVRWQNQLSLPITREWVLVYALILTGARMLIEHSTHIHLEILFPSFILGVLLHNPAHVQPVSDKGHGHLEKPSLLPPSFDQLLNGLFMFLVGCSLPKIHLGDLDWGIVAVHLLALMILSNLGKCFLVTAYRGVVPSRERLALSIAMFPRGEVGAGVLLIALGYGIGGIAVGLAILNLAANLFCTGIFVVLVIRLIGFKRGD